ncbi:hypothetical protein GCM10009760_22860 [Kitasatospora kazusensis]|uniref:Tetratricopeptide repeat protein n=1 Tax=Kitasatospora kazusensis TaxID=407974 RepID=A0ABN2ZC86_9ACTN
MTEQSPVARLHQVLAGAGIALAPEQLAEVLWLAARVPPRGLSGAPRPTAEAPGPPPVPGPLPPPPGDPSYGAPRPAPQGTDLYAAAGTAVPGTAALPVLVRAERAIPAPRALGRALRPLRRPRPVPRGDEVDESATADLVAETGVFDLVLRPRREAWLDVTLVVDDGLSMQIWRELAVELEALLFRAGVFRRVRSLGLDTRHPDGPRLLARPFAPGRSALPPGSVGPADGRGVVLVLSDAVGAGWRDGLMDPLLAGWARHRATAVLQPLPQRMWPGTGLRAETMLLRAGRAGAANGAYRVTHPLLPPELAPFDGLPVPVLEFSPAAVSSWAALVARGSAATMPVVQVVGTPGTPVTAPGPARAGAPADMRSRLTLFRSAASPEAYRLAGHLAAVRPLTLPVMRLVQRAVLGGRGNPANLAEVLLGGLLRRAPEPVPGAAAHPVRYDFRPGLRELLLDSLPAREVLATASLVTGLLATATGTGQYLPALRADTGGRAALPPGAAAFAAAPLLRHFGPAGRLPGGPADTGQLIADIPFGALAGRDEELSGLVGRMSWRAAVERGELVLEQLLTDLGPGDPAVLGGRFDLAEWIGHAGAPQTALRLCRELRADLTERLGEEHGRLLALRAAIGYWTGGSGDPAAAVLAYRELLPEQERLLGPDHPDCLRTRHQICFWTGMGSSPPAAVLELYRELLPVQLRVLGDEDPETLRTRVNIASWTGRSGQEAESLELWQALRPDIRRVLGPDDLLALVVEAEVGHWTAALGDPAAALRLIPPVLPRITELLGPQHSTPYAFRRRIAHWTGEVGDVAGAVDLLADLLADAGRALTPEDPVSLGIRAEYAYWTARAGDPAAGEGLLRDLLPELDGILGPGHPDTEWVRAAIEQFDRP